MTIQLIQNLRETPETPTELARSYQANPHELVRSVRNHSLLVAELAELPEFQRRARVTGIDGKNVAIATGFLVHQVTTAPIMFSSNERASMVADLTKTILLLVQSGMDQQMIRLTNLHELDATVELPRYLTSLSERREISLIQKFSADPRLV